VAVGLRCARVRADTIAAEAAVVIEEDA